MVTPRVLIKFYFNSILIKILDFFIRKLKQFGDL